METAPTHTGAAPFVTTMSSEEVQDAFIQAGRRLERQEHPEAPGRGSSPASLFSAEDMRHAFARERWRLMAVSGDAKQVRIARARLGLPQGATWEWGAHADVHLGIVGLTRSRRRLYVEWLKCGDDAADWGIVVAWALFSEIERFEALWRIFGRMRGPPITPIRWISHLSDFRAGEENLNERVDVIALFRGFEAVARALKHHSPIEVIEDPEGVMRRFRTDLERLLCEEFLSPSWRSEEHERRLPSHNLMRRLRRLAPKQGAPEAFDEAGPAAAAAGMADALLDGVEISTILDVLLDAAALTCGERDVLDLDRDGWSTAEIAAALDTTQPAVRRRRCDATRKLRAVASSPSMARLRAVAGFGFG